MISCTYDDGSGPAGGIARKRGSAVGALPKMPSRWIHHRRCLWPSPYKIGGPVAVALQQSDVCVFSQFFEMSNGVHLKE